MNYHEAAEDFIQTARRQAAERLEDLKQSHDPSLHDHLAETVQRDLEKTEGQIRLWLHQKLTGRHF